MTQELRAVARHSAIYGLASVLNRGAAFFLIPIYAHFMLPAEYGTFALITSTSELVGALLGMGLGMAMSRIYFDYAGERERGVVVTTTIMGTCAIFAAFSLPVVLFAEPLGRLLLDEDGQGTLLILGIFGLLLNSVFTMGLQYLRVRQRSRAFLVASTLRSLAYLGLNSIFVAGLGWGARGALAGILAANGLLALGLVVPVLVKLGPRFSPQVFRSTVRFALPLLPGSLAETLLGFADRSMIKRLISADAVGVFQLGSRMSSVLYAILIVPFGQIYVPRRLEAHGTGSDDREAPRIFTYFFLLVVTAALGMALLAPEAVRIVARPDYAEAAGLLPLICLAQVELSLLIIVQMGIFYRKVSRHLMTSSVAMLALHVPLSIALILAMGIQGAALAACLSSGFKVAVTVYLGRGLGGPRPEWGRLAGILGAGGAAFSAGSATGLLAPGFPWTGIACRALLAAAFPAALIASPLFTREERRDLIGLIAARFRKRRRPAPEPAAVSAGSLDEDGEPPAAK